MGALLGRLIAAQRTQQTAADGIPLAYLGRLARAFAPDTADTGPRGRTGTVAVAGLVEPLSDRELEVLRLLAAGKPNKQIAEELVVALSTVKKHVAHILDKLGAANRTEATAPPASSACCANPGRHPATTPGTPSGQVGR